MKILYILSGTESKDGSTKSFLAMADSVAKAGNEIAVVVPDDNGVTPVLRERGWTVLVVPYMFATLPYLSWSLRDLIRFIPRLVLTKYINRKARKTVNAFAREWGPDIVHDNTSVTDLGHYVARALDVPHVIHIREYGWRGLHRIIPGIHKRLSATNTYVVAITSDLAAYRGKRLRLDHLRVIYNGVLRENDATYNPQKQPFFLYAGRIRKEKGVGDLINAYIAYARAELNAGRDPLRLKLAGASEAGDFDCKVRRIVSNAGLDAYVEWLGEIDNISDLYEMTAATVIPSKHEGFGRVMPEAMCAGSLCVVRNTGGLAEQLANGRRECGNDIAIGFNSIEDLTLILSRISDAYRNGGAYDGNGSFLRIIKDSTRVVAALYSYEANARGMLDFYSYIFHSSNKNQT